MIRELLLLRHGKAHDHHPDGDFFRELRNKGKRGAQRIGVWLDQNQLAPDRVISSSATRALNTAQKCCKAMGLPGTLVDANDEVYLASSSTLLQQVRNTSASHGRLLLVGHNPGLEQLAQELCATPATTEPLLPTATLARIAINTQWHALQPGNGRLLNVQRASDLPHLFPWPHAHGSELRERPAYYYNQSSVIPYRTHQGEIQILIVRSSSGRHWVVPKGIADPGLSRQASALKEAYEEAGIEGMITGETLGTYSYEKWGAECSVEVFAMRVQKELPEHEWQETHRGRRWVTARDARVVLKERALAPMIDALLEREAACPA